ncbi:MAG: thioredoxin family protein, partial [Bacteroidota bacterium]
TLTSRDAFQFEVEIDKPIFAEFKHAGINFPVFLNPDNAVSITLLANTPKQGKVIFRGPGKADNTFYLEYFNFLIKELENKKLEEMKRIRAREFKQFVERREKAKFDFIKNYLDQQQVTLSPALQIWIRNDINYNTAELLLKYPYLFSVANNGLRKKEMPKKYYKFLETVRINNDQAIHQPSYRSFLEGYFFNYRLETAKDWQYLTSPERQYEYVNRFFVGKARYYLQSVILKEGINQSPEIMEEYYYSFLDGKAPRPLKRNIRSLFVNATRSVKGELLSSSALMNKKGQAIHPDFFRNRVSYIYFWSYRKESCLYEMRYIRTLARKFEDDDKVNIVLVNTDPDLNGWYNFLQKDEYKLAELPVQQLALNQSANSDFLKKYKIDNVPEFFLVDRMGRIVSNRSWPPSSGGVPRHIRQLLARSNDSAQVENR